MGRIYEALRRAGADQDAAVVNHDSEPFVSPWPADERAGEQGRVNDARTTDPGRQRLGEVVNTFAPILVEGSADFTGFSPAWRDRLVTAPNADPRLVEQFRGLAAILHRVQIAGKPRVLMVTSAEPGEGKTLTAVNLSLTLSSAYRRRVLLVEADLRRPSIREISQLKDLPGLSEALKNDVDARLPVIRVSEMLTILPSGAPDPMPMSGLTSPRMRRILADAAERFDWVVLDAPPVVPVPDAGLLCELVDAALLVVRARTTQHALVQKAIEVIGRERMLGVILNGVDSSDVGGYSPYYGYREHDTGHA
jgi:capsular exopolysaccharide synthesis family protein